MPKPKAKIVGFPIKPPCTAREFMESVVVDDNGCWVWQRAKKEKGYGIKGFRVQGKHFNIYAHRLSWWVFKGEYPGKRLVCHSCDNPPCCNPAHLFLGTYKDNTVDGWRKGRIKLPRENVAGERNPKAKLSKEDVIRIRNSLKVASPLNKTMVALAEEYRVSVTCIQHIYYRRSWTDI